MAKCPECGKELDYLHALSIDVLRYECGGVYDYINKLSDTAYKCPKCDMEIAWSEDEADEILKNED